MCQILSGDYQTLDIYVRIDMEIMLKKNKQQLGELLYGRYR